MTKHATRLRSKCYGMWKENRIHRGLGKVLWRKKHLNPTFKVGILTGKGGSGKDILVFPHRENGWLRLGYQNNAVALWRHDMVLPSQLWKQMDCLPKEWSILCFGEYSSRVGQPNMLDPDIASSAASHYFFYSWYTLGTPALKGDQSGTFKSQVQKKSKE